jgi:16S rRNA pseudouridine516 synthase
VVKYLVTLVANKPQWYISSDIDEGEYASYNDLIYDCPYSQLVHVAGRLDADTEWLLLCTSDWKLTQSIVHPKNKCEKEYFVRTSLPINQRMIDMLVAWVLMDWDVQALPAKVEQLADTELMIIITEWKYHQVKRMLRAVGNEVVYLRRDRIWDIVLDDLALGEWKYIDNS